MRLFSIFKKSTTLYFPGCYTYFKYPEFFELYKKIFNKLGINYKILDKKVCCGLPAAELGYDSEARKLARRNFEIFKEGEITSIITSSPCCYKSFLYDYPKILPDWNIEPKNIWRMILSKLENSPDLIKNKAECVLAYHDSCYLGRYCDIYEEPRKILKLIGYEIKEMLNSKEESFCCGSCGGLMTTNPELADELARERILQAKREGIKKIVVASAEDYYLLKKNPIEGIQIIELSEILASALGMKELNDNIREIDAGEKNQEFIEDIKENQSKEDIKSKEDIEE